MTQDEECSIKVGLEKLGSQMIIKKQRSFLSIGYFQILQHFPADGGCDSQKEVAQRLDIINTAIIYSYQFH